jgi:V8-like Glu-specific endopeptidase
MSHRDEWLLGLLLAATGCGAPAPTGVAQRQDPVIYGTDDRLEYFQETDPKVQALLRDSTAMMVDPRDIDAGDPQNVQLKTVSLMASSSTCASEPYATEPTAALCSVTLIDDDLVLTAGHCIGSAADCAATAFVFHFNEQGPGQLATITADDVYRCQQLVAHALTADLDFAVARLDRKATPGHAVAPVAPSRTYLTAGDALVLLGYPLGLPGKSDRGHVVDPRRATADWFTATIDAYSGNSGSGVYDALGRVVGLESSGSADFVQMGGCFVSAVLADDGSQGTEQVSYAFTAIEALCSTPTPPARLCAPDAGGADAGGADAGGTDAGGADGGRPDAGPGSPDGGAGGGGSKTQPCGCATPAAPGLGTFALLVIALTRARNASGRVRR